MHDRVRYFAFIVLDESDSGFDDLQEEPGFGFSKQFQFRLPGQLGHQLAAFVRDGQRDGGREFVTANVLIQNFRFNFDFGLRAGSVVLFAENNGRFFPANDRSPQ